MNSSGFLCIGHEFLEVGHDFFRLVLILWFGLDFYGLAWIFRAGPDLYEFVVISVHCLRFLWIPLNFYTFVMISMEFFWISMSRPWLLQFCLDVFGLIWIFKLLWFLWICVDFYALIMISKNSWILWIHLDCDTLVTISMNSPEFLCVVIDFYGIYMDQSGFFTVLTLCLGFGLDL